MLNSIVSVPACLFAALIASRREQSPGAISQVPYESAAVLTVYVGPVWGVETVYKNKSLVPLVSNNGVKLLASLYRTMRLPSSDMATGSVRPLAVLVPLIL